MSLTGSQVNRTVTSLPALSLSLSLSLSPLHALSTTKQCPQLQKPKMKHSGWKIPQFLSAFGPSLRFSLENTTAASHDLTSDLQLSKPSLHLSFSAPHFPASTALDPSLISNSRNPHDGIPDSQTLNTTQVRSYFLPLL